MYPGPNIRVIVRPMGKIRYSRSLSGQSRVHCFSDRNDPRTPFHWPARAAPRRWPHFRRVHPIVATQLPKSTRFLYPPTRKWPVMHGHFDQQPTLSSSRFMLSPLPTASAMNHPSVRHISVRHIHSRALRFRYRFRRPYTIRAAQRFIQTAVQSTTT